MNVLLVAATPFEIAPTRQFLEKNFGRSDASFKNGSVSVDLLETGPGLLATATHLTRALLRQPFDLVLHAGVAGSLVSDFPPGSVVQVVSETLGDFGLTEADGAFVPLFDLDWMDADAPPFRRGQLDNPSGGAFNFLPRARGLTVNRTSGDAVGIAALRHRFPHAQVESMEGAAVFYVCGVLDQQFLAVRSISNWVEPRDRAGWKLEVAIEQLNGVVIELLGQLAE